MFPIVTREMAALQRLVVRALAEAPVVYVTIQPDGSYRLSQIKPLQACTEVRRAA